MAEKATIARPYARAAFEYAREHGRLAQWADALTTASAVVADERVEPLLGNPLVADEELLKLVTGICGSGLDQPMRNFLATLVQNRRLALLPEIAASFQGMRAEVENVADVEVVSAVTLDEAQRARLIAALKKRLGREVRLTCEVDPQLIGGAIVRAGDLVIDGSLRTRLERLASAIAG